MIIKANTTTVKIGEKEYDFSFNFGVIKLIQAKLKGTKVEDIFKGVENQDFNIILEILFAGIKWNHSDIKMRELEELGLNDFEEVFAAIGRVFENSMPKTDAEKVENGEVTEGE